MAAPPEAEKADVDLGVTEELNITMGMSFRFLLVENCSARRADWLMELESTQGGSENLLRRILSDPFHHYCERCRSWIKYSLSLQTSDTKCRTNRWSVAKNAGLGLSFEELTHLPGHPRDWRVHGLELETRMSYLDRPIRTLSNDAIQPGHVCKIHLQHELAAVMERLQTSFNENRTGWSAITRHIRMVVNQNCHLDVHLGNELRGFPLQTVKNAVTIATLWEQQIDLLYPVHRIGGTKLATSPPGKHETHVARGAHSIGDSKHLSWSHQLMTIVHRERGIPGSRLGALKRRDWRRRSLYDWRSRILTPIPRPGRTSLQAATWSFDRRKFFYLIQDVPSVKGLQELCLDRFERFVPLTLSLEELQTYDPDNTVPNPNKLKRTLRFCQSAGTLDPEEAFTTVLFNAAIVKYAHRLTAQGSPSECSHCLTVDWIGQRCSDYWSKSTFSLVDMFKELRLSPWLEQRLKYSLGLLSEKSSFALNHYHGTRKSIAAHQSPGHEAFKPLLNHLNQRRVQLHRPSRTRLAVLDKFLSGGYGHFEPAYLDECGVD